MTGCYGNHPEDRYFEEQLNDHLERNDLNDDEPAEEEEEPDVEELQLQNKFLIHQHENDEAAAKMLLFTIAHLKAKNEALEAMLVSLRGRVK